MLSDEEREAFRQQAAAEHLSLSNWLRQAGLKRLEAQQQRPIRTTAELREFFTSLPDESEPEPDWERHLQVIQESRGSGASTT
ncbi:antitoxin [Mycobacterium sp.]|uniref:antitoxin n=1 Tax=Mycobacterium sp. TaxID=1785 RepID=UPI0031D43B23